MEIPEQKFHIDDETVIQKVDGKSLRYFQLRSNLISYFKQDKADFLKSDGFREELPDAIIRCLGQKGILDMGEQVTGFKKALLDKLVEDFSDPYKFLLEMERLEDLPLFRNQIRPEKK